MDLVYNELSAAPLSNSEATANQKIENFVETYSSAAKTGFKKIRFPVILEEIILSEGYSIKDWLNKSSKKNLKEILLGARMYPEYDINDEWFGEEYIKSKFTFREQEDSEPVKCFGLASASIYNTLSLSLESNGVWSKNVLIIEKTDEETREMQPVSVNNVFSANCFTHISISDFVESIKSFELTETHLQPDEKTIHLRDDHHTDVLKDHAKLLFQSPYVVCVINSIAWRSQETRYIKEVFGTGIIYIRLHKTDQGLGMAIQTTGTNLKETKAIAEILRQQFDR